MIAATIVLICAVLKYINEMVGPVFQCQRFLI